MKLKFAKYQATGNDFIMIDDRLGLFPRNDKALISRLCDRRFGIGADGLILIDDSPEADFTMIYFNADGGQGSFCGNGSRAATRFAESLGIVTKSGSLMAFDGLHRAEIDSSVIKMTMANVQNGSKILDGTFIDTGSPHYVEFHEKVDSLDVFADGKRLRYDKNFQPGGSNINFVEKMSKSAIKVRTYERGVENETLSCGTGVTAAALCTASVPGSYSIDVSTLGGKLAVKFYKTEAGFENIRLIGPAVEVFTGKLEI